MKKHASLGKLKAPRRGGASILIQVAFDSAGKHHYWWGGGTPLLVPGKLSAIFRRQCRYPGSYRATYQDKQWSVAPERLTLGDDDHGETSQEQESEGDASKARAHDSSRNGRAWSRLSTETRTAKRRRSKRGLGKEVFPVAHRLSRWSALPERLESTVEASAEESLRRGRVKAQRRPSRGNETA